jgi:DNA-directed RNA polymerase specialized sigma subunit
MISHRPSTLKNANKIYVLSEGRITESGTFEHLLAKKGDFYKFYRTASMEGEEEIEEAVKLKLKIEHKEKEKEKAKKALKLSPIEKKVLKMYYEDMDPYAKIARELGLNPYDVALIRKSASEKLKRIKELEE